MAEEKDLITQADDALSRNEPIVAVVLANAALEETSQGVLASQLLVHGLPDDAVAGILSYIRNFNPVRDPRFLALLEGLLIEDEMKVDEEIIKDLKRARQIRNSTVHQGQAIPISDAKESVAVIKRAVEKLEATIDKDQQRRFMEDYVDVMEPPWE